MKLVSIIINCNNGERFLFQCIKSILNQSYNNWEIIFWDNNSSDNSKKIIKKIKDKRIKYFFSNKYTSLYKARNLALSKAKGEYICFLDTDDEWTKNKLKNQIKVMTGSKADIIFSNYFINSKKIKKRNLKLKKNFYIDSKNLTQQLLKNYSIGLLTVMVKKSIFKKNKFNSNYQIIGDFDFFIKMSLKYNFYYISKPLAIYRIHENNLSTNKISLYIRELKTWLLKNNLGYKKFNLFFIKYFLFKLILKKTLGIYLH